MVVDPQVPALQGEQVEGDVAPVTVEYVPASRFEDKRLDELTKGEGEKVRDVLVLLSCIILPGDKQNKYTRTCKKSKGLPYPKTNTTLNPNPNRNLLTHNCQLSCETKGYFLSYSRLTRTQTTGQHLQDKAQVTRGLDNNALRGTVQ